MIRHMVFIKYGPSVPQETKDGIISDLADLVSQIEGTVDFQNRANLSPETAVVHGFLDMFWFDFRDVAVRDSYLVDPVHQVIGGDIVALTEGGADGVFVCDIEL